MSWTEILEKKGLDYDRDVMAADFHDEYEYWDKMAEFSICGPKIHYNLEKIRHILGFLCDYELRQKNILEVGVGLGMVAKAMAVSGLITNYRATECGRGFIKYMNETCNAKVDMAKMDMLPYKDKSFDVVFLFDVLEHIKPDEKIKSYEELLRVIRDKKQIFINLPSMGNMSFHNKEYDYEFGFGMLEQFAEFMGCDIRRIKHYRCDNYGKMPVPNYYHMVELS